MQVAIGFKWWPTSVLKSCITFSLICANVEATATAGHVKGYWKLACSSSCDDQQCPSGGPAESVVRQRSGTWDREFSESISNSIRSGVTFGGRQISLENTLIDSVTKLILIGHDHTNTANGALKTSRVSPNCNVNVWWQWMMEIDDISITDDMGKKFTLQMATPNFWHTISLDKIPKCTPGQCVEQDCQKCIGGCKPLNATDFGERISLNKPTEQSTTYRRDEPRFGASAAVDGNVTSHSHSEDGGNDMKPWWRIDLGSKFLVHRVRILTHHVYMDDRLNNFEVKVGNFDPKGIPLNTQITENDLCYYYDKGGKKQSEYITMDCPKPGILGRYVTIQIIKVGARVENVLVLAEVDVYGTECI